ncbi:MAG TPA: hypothetical protein PLW50_00460 [Smithellaceae bacterium]|nr:hypothetical protein [Smithellaceae bacterium]
MVVINGYDCDDEVIINGMPRPSSSDISPAPPTSLSLTEVTDHVHITFEPSVTTGVDRHEIWEAISTGDYSLIGMIPTALSSGTVEFDDYVYDRTGTIYYNVFAIKHGVRSSIVSGNVAVVEVVADPDAVTSVPGTNEIIVSVNVSADRRLESITINKDAQTTSAALTEVASVPIYTGLLGTIAYAVPDADIAKYHRFWAYSNTRSA